MFCGKAKRPAPLQERCCLSLFVGKTKPSLLMEFCQNLNNAKLLPVFQNFILLTNLNLKQKFKWGFILYRGSCDKVVSWYIFHARLGSYIIFAKISIQSIYYSKYSPLYSPKPISSLNPSLLSARKVLTRSFLNKSFMPLACTGGNIFNISLKE